MFSYCEQFSMHAIPYSYQFCNNFLLIFLLIIVTLKILFALGKLHMNTYNIAKIEKWIAFRDRDALNSFPATSSDVVDIV